MADAEYYDTRFAEIKQLVKDGNIDQAAALTVHTATESGHSGADMDARAYTDLNAAAERARHR
jgi:hypothetical protein